MAPPRPLHVPPRRDADPTGGSVQNRWKESFGQAPRGRIDAQRRALFCQLGIVVEQRRVGVENLIDGFRTEDRLGDQQLVSHIHVLPLQRVALRDLEYQVRGHQARRDRPAGEVVDRFATVRERMQQAEQVHRDVCEVAMSVINYQVEIDVV